MSGTNPRTVEDTKRHLANLKEFVGHDDPQRLTAEDLRRWRDALKADGLTNNTWNNRLSLIGRVIERAVKDQRLTTNPTQGLRLEKSRPATRLPYSDEDPARILNACRSEKRASIRWSHGVQRHEDRRGPPTHQARH